MTFEEALILLKQGKHLIRQGWDGSEEYIFLVQNAMYQSEPINPYFLIRTQEVPALSVFQPTDCDLLADDWKIVK
ncbi:DUF2829 domain-containing protein [Bombilactobacillus folatiphilus]|uniref:DUF2829 domain-containing protein n=1 Tax=Bombilactobacillus folatiphilus TaxID=2923362 RepID=A0ABY4P857_9LACO|nr:DUF2829 domain-containing protein [Bombilactobacillus folatiphilus]UQS81711.1 DUF2829 domain-containing protein [Bombilactobacillus folatiphilus]